MQHASLAALAGITVHYVCFYLFGWPLLPEAIAEWIMARTPSQYALWILDALGPWAKPSAVTGGLATLGAVLWVSRLHLGAGIAAALGLTWFLGFSSIPASLSFWLPAAGVLFLGTRQQRQPAPAGRRRFVLAGVMSAGTLTVALESFFRDRLAAATAVKPVPLFSFEPPPEREPFLPPLVRKAVTPVNEFYGMSKNTVDPVIDPATWRLRITVDGRPLRELRYQELLTLPREQRYVSLRCISNTLQSNLMGTALWSGVRLSQLVDRGALPTGIVEAAVIGVDGHGDSFPLDYAFGEEPLFALGMNGDTLNRTHGFPIRLLVPRYYGFKHVKWIGEIRFVSQPYLGTWPRLGYTKDPTIHTVCYIDRVRRAASRNIEAGGIAFAGSRGIRRVQVRADGGDWLEADCEQPLSAYTWTRWRVVIPVMNVTLVHARAMDGAGRWQSEVETPLFPDGVDGPTVRKVSL